MPMFTRSSHQHVPEKMKHYTGNESLAMPRPMLGEGMRRGKEEDVPGQLHMLLQHPAKDLTSFIRTETQTSPINTWSLLFNNLLPLEKNNFPDISTWSFLLPYHDSWYNYLVVLTLVFFFILLHIDNLPYSLHRYTSHICVQTVFHGGYVLAKCFLKHAQTMEKAK